jgi:hypothetical protein
VARKGERTGSPDSNVAKPVHFKGADRAARFDRVPKPSYDGNSDFPGLKALVWPNDVWQDKRQQTPDEMRSSARAAQRWAGRAREKNPPHIRETVA